MHAAMTHKTNKISLLVLIWTCYTVGDGQVVSYEVDESHATLPVLTWWESTGKYPDYVISCETQQRCLVSRNKTRLQHQEVMVSYHDNIYTMYVFYGSFFLSSALPFPRKDGDIWALIHEESPMNKDWLFSFRSTIELFNYTSTFKRGSDYPLTTHWLTNKETLLSKEYLVPTDRKNVMRTDGGLAPIIFVHSDCNTPSNREQYVKTLQKYVDVDSYGPCLHNKDFPEEFKNLDGIAGFLKPDFLRFVARYKFAMAFENAICGDYITEKLWRPLQVGTVPIVLGSPTIRMATSQIEKVSEFLTCVICQELYTDPCTLRCDHTFCRKCVTGYIQTRPDAVQSKTIPCAFCRQDTKVPHPSRPVEEWAGQIKPSIIIQGLIDTQGDVIKTGSASCCSVCEKLGETTPGASWCSECQVSLCERCVKIHRASPASHDHEICDLSGEVKVKRRRKFICREHKDEVIKLVCKDCHKAVCQTCYVVYHRKYKISLLVLIWTCYTVGDGQVVSYEVDESHATLPVLTWWESPGKYPDYVISCETQQRCLVSRNKTRLQHQEVMVSNHDNIYTMYVFYGSFFLSSGLPFPRKDGDIWALIHEESPMNKDWLFSFRSTIELFNYTSTFKRGSDYPLTTHWLTNKETLLSKEYLVPTDRRNVMRTDGGLAPIIYVHRDCNTPSNREQYVTILQKYVDVDSYGPCLHNKDFPEEFSTV
ncbi:uncharacterized protein LOC124151241 isoform X3 [Haliotis rufescens]|uniref:uncharacterized protein LOC124151241 isoform X3 n=1 Tax=Haliotis rufescens TaxID=6454 RepID=UPI00201E7C95|nr:uncharacterized protein LOC124151241 isoform X3 [Haliotis rufescens]